VRRLQVLSFLKVGLQPDCAPEDALRLWQLRRSLSQQKYPSLNVIDPILIIQGSQMLARYFPDLPDRYSIATSHTGYTNDEISLGWVKHWGKESRKVPKGIC
jgi:hypothetical protein